jgi:ABC-type sugar transport system permease subunit
MRFLFAAFITILSLFYFLPFAIAFHKKRVNTGAIFALNLFLGWTLIGWVISLVWALKDENTI